MTKGATVDATTILERARAALEATADRTAEVVRSLPDLDVLIPNSEWTVREAAVHLVNSGAIYAEIAVGGPSPVALLGEEACLLLNLSR